MNTSTICQAPETAAATTTLADALYRKKVLGCFLGKAVGGTLGAPYEGCRGPHRLSFYDPVPTEMIPNDDLDLQLVWLDLLKKMPAPKVGAQLLAPGWLDNIAFPFDEYGIAIRNLKNGIRPPFSGSYDNPFTSGMGAAIRSEIWACLARGNVGLAAAFAHEDGCVDHAGDGLAAEIFLAAMQAAAFHCSDLGVLIETGLSYLPAGSRLDTAIRDTIRWHGEEPDFAYLFDRIMAKYRTDNFTEVAVNLPIVVAALLLGRGDFAASICHAANFGEDSDCTAASLGALLGILDPDAIPPEWLAPIGRKIVLSREIVGVTPPATLDELADEICAMSRTVRLDPHPAAGFIPRKIRAEATVTDHGKVIVPARTVEFDGHTQAWPETLPTFHAVLRLVFPFRLAEAGRYTLMFNSVSRHTVRLDGCRLFRRDGGPVVPSFHRAPWNQAATLELAAGEHRLEVEFERIPPGVRPAWTVGITERDSLQWHPTAFTVPAEEPPLSRP